MKRAQYNGDNNRKRRKVGDHLHDVERVIRASNPSCLFYHIDTLKLICDELHSYNLVYKSIVSLSTKFVDNTHVRSVF
jgi:hypothetical protein